MSAYLPAALIIAGTLIVLGVIAGKVLARKSEAYPPAPPTFTVSDREVESLDQPRRGEFVP